MKCKVCGITSNKVYDEKILNKYTVDYFQCSNCLFLQTEEPYWLEEAYSESINISDTGYMARNIRLSKILSVFLFLEFGKRASFLDYAGGYGVFVRLMRDIGFDFYWADKYTNNTFAQGFEWDDSITLSAISAFEVFEHFVNPMGEIEELLKLSETIIFSTELYPIAKPKPQEWWYFGLEHGQHISFYSKETLYFIAQKYSMKYYNLGMLHIITKRNISKRVLYLSKFFPVLFPIISKSFLKSKTFSDHKYIVKKEFTMDNL